MNDDTLVIFASEAMNALLSRVDLKFVFQHDGSKPAWNSWMDTNQRDQSAPKILAKLAFDMAEAMIQEKTDRQNKSQPKRY